MQGTLRGWEGLPPISKTLYLSTYFIPSEVYSEWLKRIVEPYQNDVEHGNRIKAYISNYWYHPSTPISTGAGLPIACYVSHTDDSNEGIFDGNLEGSWLGAMGGGVGRYWGDVGGLGRPIRANKELLSTMTWVEIQQDDDIMKSSGIIPFLGVPDRYTYSISQAGTRRATEASYIPISHPDIKAFIEIRLETGDTNRRMPNLHHGIVIPDAFMRAVSVLDTWDLICPKTGIVTETIDAFDLWMDILIIRKTEAGEPFLLFIDSVNRANPEEYLLSGREVSGSNICSEVVEYTDKDTTCTCNLGSLNLEQWDEYEEYIDVIAGDLSDFHDNVNKVFLERTGKYTGTKAEAFKRARKSIIEEGNIGIGVMGWHSLLQKNRLPFESPMASGLNIRVFKAIGDALQKHQDTLHDPCELSKAVGTNRRNVHLSAIAPTMSISNLSKLTSSGIEPQVANAYVKKLIQGTFTIKNRYLSKLIEDTSFTMFKMDVDGAERWQEEQWKSINKYGGSVQHLDWMDDWDKDVYKTAFEINQLSIIKQAADRQPSITQSQSLNVFLPAECSYEELHTVHFRAWELGVKSLYYLRSQPEIQVDVGSSDRQAITLEDDTCTSCT